MSNKFILISRAKIVKPWLLSPSYDVYIIETTSKGWKAERREDQFRTLQKLLKKYFPGYAIPIIPKQPLAKYTEPLILAHRIKLQIFLDSIIGHQLLGNTDIFIKFISLPAEKDFDNFVLSYQMKNFPIPPSDCYTYEGVANITRDKDIQDECMGISIEIKNIEDYFSK